MKEIYTEIYINASADIVWNIMTDLEAYKEWNPFIRESHGEAVLGCRLTCRPEVFKGRLQTYHPTVTTVETNRVFAWTGNVVFPWLVEGEHIFEIEPVDEKCVRLVHRQEFRGLLSPIMGSGLINKRTREGFIRMNEALKVKAEQMMDGSID